MSNTPIRNLQSVNPLIRNSHPIQHTAYNIQHNYIEVPTSKGLLTICLQHIIRIQGLSNYSRIFFSNGRYPLTVARVLKKFEEILPQGSFIRSHRAHLVNRDFIQEVDIKQRSLYLSNGETICISRRKRMAVGG